MIEFLSDTAANIPWHKNIWATFSETVSQGRLPHAMLLLGASGTGKTILAHRFAASLLCQNDMPSDRPCGVCKSCSQVTSRTNPGLRVFEPEEAGKQLKVDTIRELTAQSTLAVEKGKHSVYIIRSAGTMNTAAANALLKTLEEPVSGLVVLLLAESRHQLPATILSRCQQLTLATPSLEVSISWLQAQNKTLDAEAALRVAHGAPLTALHCAEDQSMDTYQSLFRSFIDLAHGKLSATQAAETWSKSADLLSALNLLLTWVEDLIRLAMTPVVETNLSLNIDPDLKTLAKRIDLTELFSFRGALLQTKQQRQHNLNAQLVLDDLFIQWTKLSLQ